ncbi:gamma-glutamyl-gamma-aminobutyrate hydrolase family protein [Nocardia sp. NPDC005978]|uniref:gamma-glutamyl-gamma-aminobutyrate hydrolase family protein n=1 Tax=Nocardia sp. NPDC005978 TaxID=3156725 RepID=UPI0033A91FF9
MASNASDHDTGADGPGHRPPASAPDQAHPTRRATPEAAAAVRDPAPDAPAFRPVIGLTTYSERARYGVWDQECALLPRDYVDLVEHAGGTAVLLPPVGAARRELVRRLDGIVLTGGADLEPSRYGAAPDPATRGTRPERDESEFSLFELARAEGIPVLAVCRGLQLVNAALGGTLVQHLPDVLGHTDHARTPGIFGATRVTTVAGSLVAAIIGPEVKANCHHHQAIERLAEPLRATAHAADGTIEAIESHGESFLIGVQWHPEADLTDHRLMRALVAAATTYGQERDR